jgi:hypothetical protein
VKETHKKQAEVLLLFLSASQHRAVDTLKELQNSGLKLKDYKW